MLCGCTLFELFHYILHQVETENNQALPCCFYHVASMGKAPIFSITFHWSGTKYDWLDIWFQHINHVGKHPPNRN